MAQKRKREVDFSKIWDEIVKTMDIPEDNGMWKMNPPLRAREDRNALIAGLLDGQSMLSQQTTHHTQLMKKIYR